MKKLFSKAGLAPAVALTAGLGLLLGACSGGGSSSSDPSSNGGGGSQSGPVELRMTVWTADETQLGMFQDIADEYIAANPDKVSKVTFETIPFADYTTTLTTQMAGNPPDLAWILESYAPEFVSSGALVDLKPTLQAAEGYQFDDLLSSSLSLWEQDGGLFAYPFSNSPFAMFVNTDLISDAGADNPADLVASGNWNYDKAREISKAVVDNSDKQGLIVRDFDFRVWENLSTVWEGWGAAPWDASGKQCTFTSPESVEAMTWIHDAIFKDGALPGPGVTADFFAGDAAMTITQISRASALDDSFSWDLVPLPAGPAQQQSVIGQAGIGVLANGKNPAIAADFLAWFTNPSNGEKLATYFPPPRTSLLKSEILAAANPKLSEAQLQAVVVEGINGAVTKPAHKNFARIQDTVRAELDSLWRADANVESVLNDVCSVLNPLLAG